MTFRKLILFFVPLVFSLGFCSAVFAQKISKIEVEGNERLGNPAILQYVSSKVGKDFNRARIRDDLKALYNTGLFNDVRIDVEDADSGLKLIIHVKEKDYIQKVEFKGNDEVSVDDLKKALNLKTPFLWDDALVTQSTQKIRNLYRDKGFYLVTLRTEIINEGREKKLLFQVDEGTKVRVERIYIQGNKAISDSRLKDALFTKEGGFWSGMTRQGQFNEDLLVQVDSRRMQLEYLKRGFAFARVDAPSITFTPDRKSVIASYNVFEGDQYRVGKISFSGDLDFIHDPEKEAAQLASQPNRLWNYLDIQKDIQKIQDIYGDQGYAYVNVSPSWVIADPDQKILDIDYRIDKGSIVYFGRFDIAGNYETLDRVIRRELEITEGELYNVTKYRKSQENLERLGYFSTVKFIQKDILEKNRMDILIEVEEKQTGTLTLGATFSSFDRFGIQGAVSKVNLFGRGYDVSLSALFSSRRQIFNLFFRDPRVNDSDLSLSVRAFNTEVQSVDATAIRERGGTVTLGHPISDNWSVSGTYSLRDVGINIRQIIENYFPDSFGIDSSLGFSIERNTLNTREIFLPSSGSMNSLSSTHGSKYLGGDMSYWKLNYTGKKYIQVFDEDTPFLGGSVLSFGLRADYLVGTEGRSTPFNERFVPGGIYSIRGHLFRSLGPFVYTPINLTNIRDDDSELSVTQSQKLRLGGNKQLVFNMEYLFDIFKEAKIKGVLFLDIGNTFPEKEYDFLDLRKSAGFGFRWFSPLGPLRFEWGIPLDRKPGEDSVLFDFSIGAPF